MSDIACTNTAAARQSSGPQCEADGSCAGRISPPASRAPTAPSCSPRSPTSMPRIPAASLSLAVLIIGVSPFLWPRAGNENPSSVPRRMRVDPRHGVSTRKAWICASCRVFGRRRWSPKNRPAKCHAVIEAHIRRQALTGCHPRAPSGRDCTMSITRVCVFCGSSPGAVPGFAELAERLGTVLAERRLGLVYGGASVGLMGHLADAALAGGGEVIGVIPRALVDMEVAHG